MSDTDTDLHANKHPDSKKHRYSDALQDCNAHGYNDGYVFAYAVSYRHTPADIDAYLDSYGKSFRNAVRDFDANRHPNPDPVRRD